jgi:hypothetical protein
MRVAIHIDSPPWVPLPLARFAISVFLFVINRDNLLVPLVNL